MSAKEINFKLHFDSSDEEFEKTLRNKTKQLLRINGLDETTCNETAQLTAGFADPFMTYNLKIIEAEN